MGEGVLTSGFARVDGALECEGVPLHRIADTDDVVGASLLLCSDASSFITGQILTLDGGLTACQ